MGLASWSVLGAAARITETCGGKPATVVLGDGGENFPGAGTNDGNDVVVGGAGDDNIVTGQGRDRVCAGPGNDLIRGEEDDDRYLNGQGGRDNVSGVGGNDRVYGGKGDESGTVPFRDQGAVIQAVLGAGGGNDLIDGGRGFDECKPGAGNDTVRNCEE